MVITGDTQQVFAALNVDARYPRRHDWVGTSLVKGRVLYRCAAGRWWRRRRWRQFALARQLCKGSPHALVTFCLAARIIFCGIGLNVPGQQIANGVGQLLYLVVRAHGVALGRNNRGRLMGGYRARPSATRPARISSCWSFNILRLASAPAKFSVHWFFSRLAFHSADATTRAKAASQ